MAYARRRGVNQWPSRSCPRTSENIGDLADISDRTINTRWFWDWPAILDTHRARGQGPGAACSARIRDRPLLPAGPHLRQRRVPLRRRSSGCCPQERIDNFDYEVYTHAAEAARRGLRYRMDETNTAAGRGAPGVSDVAASGTWTLDTLFHAACPQPPDQPGANADCHLGATGVNVHNAEVRAYFFPQEGNAYYNAISYDPTPALGAPTPAPSYYALLLFARLAQGTTRPAARSRSTRARQARGRCATGALGATRLRSINLRLGAGHGRAAGTRRHRSRSTG